MVPHPHHSPGHHHGTGTDHAHARVLDLDAEVFGGQLDEALALAPASDVGTIVDLGAGTGVGSRLLRRRFPNARVLCVDNDPAMLHRLAEQGFDTLPADLDDGLPALDTAPDLVWMSSSLHHVRRPERLLADVRGAITDDGVLVVVELAGLPWFLADDGGLEDRCRTAAEAAGWNRHPDWRPLLAAAGFAVTVTRLVSDAPVTAAAREYAQRWLSGYGQLPGLSGEDREALRALLSRPDELTPAPRAHRTVWVATPA